jgi:guanine deaminase
MTDQDFLKLAVDKGNEKARPHNFGAVIVKDGEVIAADFNHVVEFNDPTLHAETSAIKAACQKLGSYNLVGCTMYGSHEPCLMCFSCAAWAQIERIVYAEPADEQTDFSYEFEGVSLQDLAKKLTRPMKMELIRLEHS